MPFQNTSDIWEGLFVDISRPELTKNIIISNIYRPPKFNNNNTTIRNFIDEITPVLNNLQSKSCDVVLAGDFNIDLLKINERELYGEFFYLMLSSNFSRRFRNLPDSVKRMPRFWIKFLLKIVFWIEVSVPLFYLMIFQII